MKKVGVLGLAHGHVFSFGKEWNENKALDVEIAGAWDRDPQRLKEGAEKPEGFSAAEKGLCCALSLPGESGPRDNYCAQVHSAT